MECNGWTNPNCLDPFKDSKPVGRYAMPKVKISNGPKHEKLRDQ